MSLADNPYNAYSAGQSPISGEYPPGYFQPVTRFDYMRWLRSPFLSPNWMMNLLWMFLCELLSAFVIGNLISIGYAMYVAEARSGGRDRAWLDFDINKFSDYLMRGLWPFLWQVIYSTAIFFVLGVPAASTVFGGQALMNGQDPSISSLIVWSVGGLVVFVLLIVSGVVLFASMISSGLANDFMKGADLSWIRSFVSKMFFQSILVMIIVYFTAVGFTVIGFLACCVGVMAVGPLMRLYMGDLIAQMHDIFMSRGGLPAFPVPGNHDGDVVQAQVLP